MTLIEVLVAMGIATLAGVILVVIIVNSAGLFTKESSKIEVGLNINDALAQVRGTVKQASSIAEQYTGGSATYVSGPTQLVVKIASIDASGDLIANVFDNYVFFRDSNFLRFKVFPDPLSSRQSKDQILSNSVNEVIFQYFNSATPPVEVAPITATKVRISLTLRQKTGPDFEVHTSTSEANLRND